MTVTHKGLLDSSVTRCRASVLVSMEPLGVSVQSASRVSGDSPTAGRVGAMDMQRAVTLKQVNATTAETTHQGSCVTGEGLTLEKYNKINKSGRKPRANFSIIE